MLGNMPDAARNTPKYRTPTELTVASKTYPMPPIVVRSMMVYPRCCVLSATHVETIVTRNERKNGGAVRPCESIALKPISFSIVARKTGREEKPTLHWNQFKISKPTTVLEETSLAWITRKEGTKQLGV